MHVASISTQLTILTSLQTCNAIFNSTIHLDEYAAAVGWRAEQGRTQKDKSVSKKEGSGVDVFMQDGIDQVAESGMDVEDSEQPDEFADAEED